MSLIKIKNSLIHELREDKHCVLAIKKLFDEIPHDQMKSFGKISRSPLSP